MAARSPVSRSEPPDRGGAGHGAAGCSWAVAAQAAVLARRDGSRSGRARHRGRRGSEPPAVRAAHPAGPSRTADPSHPAGPSHTAGASRGAGAPRRAEPPCRTGPHRGAEPARRADALGGARREPGAPGRPVAHRWSADHSRACVRLLGGPPLQLVGAAGVARQPLDQILSSASSWPACRRARRPQHRARRYGAPVGGAVRPAAASRPGPARGLRVAARRRASGPRSSGRGGRRRVG